MLSRARATRHAAPGRAIAVLAAVLVATSSGCRVQGDDPKPARASELPVLLGLYSHRDYWIAFEFLPDNRVNMWHRWGPDAPLKGESAGIVTYSESGSELVVTHSCGKDRFTKTAQGLYYDSIQMLFRKQ